jgi:catechol 2,3-dioxygenase-like lactoylglutathione lyase family enzyme
MFKLEGIDHIALAVRDVERSVAWYRDILGLERRFETQWGSFPAIVGVGTTSVALFPVQGSNPAPPPGRDVIAMRHFAFRVDRANFGAARKSLEERGIPIEFQDHGAAHSIYFNDPDGHRLEITTYEVQ